MDNPLLRAEDAPWTREDRPDVKIALYHGYSLAGSGNLICLTVRRNSPRLGSSVKQRTPRPVV